MSWVAVNGFYQEVVFDNKPTQMIDSPQAFPYWVDRHPYRDSYGVNLPAGSILKLTGRELTWNDEPVELK